MEHKSDKPFIRLRGVDKSFGGVQALKSVDLDLYPGEIHTLAGENGSGKSTLIKILAGVYQPDGGVIEIGGQQFQKITPIESVRLGVQIIYQDFSIFPNLTVRENIAISAEIMNGTKIVRQKRVTQIATDAMNRLGLNIDPEVRVERLSVANKQLVALARAIHHDAKLVVMDEPTAALTHNEVLSLFNVIKDLKREGITVLFVSHKIDEVFSISENYTILRSGERVANGMVSDLTYERFTYYMTGRELSFTVMRRETKEAPVLEVKNLKRLNFFSDISFSLHRGEMLAITGFLGSGRTEIAQALFGIHPADSGQVFIDGQEAGIHSVKDALRHGIGYIPEDRLTEGLFMRRSIMDNAIITNIDTHCNGLGVIRKQEAFEEGAYWMRAMKLNTEKYGMLVSALSGGNQQKVILSRWLATKPKIFILNCPTFGVDIGAKFDLHAILRDLSESGVSIIIISDDIPEVLACSDRILIMRDGDIISELQTRKTSEDAITNILYAS